MLRRTNKNKKYALRKIGKYFGPCVIGTMIAIGVAVTIPLNEVHAIDSVYIPHVKNASVNNGYEVHEPKGKQYIRNDEVESHVPVLKKKGQDGVKYIFEKDWDDLELSGRPHDPDYFNDHETRNLFVELYAKESVKRAVSEGETDYSSIVDEKGEAGDPDEKYVRKDVDITTVNSHAGEVDPETGKKTPAVSIIDPKYPHRIDSNSGTKPDKYDPTIRVAIEGADGIFDDSDYVVISNKPITVDEDSDENIVKDDGSVVLSRYYKVVTGRRYVEGGGDTIEDANKEDDIYEVGTKPKVVTEEIPYTTRYERDDTKGRDYRVVTTQGKNGKRITTTTYTLNTTNGDVTENKPTVEVTDAIEEVITLGTKPKVEETPIKKPVRYEADPTKPKGETTTETEGEDGKVVTTTPYIVNSDGSVTEGEPTTVRTEPKEKVVKVGTKQKDDIREISITTTYEDDPTLEKGTEKVVTEGKAGSETITTRYIVDPNTGKITETTSSQTTKVMTPKVVKRGTKEVAQPNLKVAQPTIAIVEEPNKASIQVKAPEKDADTVRIIYPKSDGSGDEELTLTKQSNGEWTLDKQPENVILNKETGTVTIPREAVVNKQKVQAQSRNGNSDYTSFVYAVLSIAEANPVGLVTRWVAQIDNITLKTLRDEVSGKEPAGEFEGYKWLSSRLEDGILTHTFEINSGNLPPVNLIPEKPSETENPVIRTVWRDENGKDLKTPSVEKQEAGEVEGYEFVESHREGDNLTVHVFRTKKSQTPSPAPAKVSEQKGEAVATSEKPVENGTSTNESDKAELPNTGTETNASLASAGIMTLLAGLGLGFFKKKEDEN